MTAAQMVALFGSVIAALFSIILALLASWGRRIEAELGEIKRDRVTCREHCRDEHQRIHGRIDAEAARISAHDVELARLGAKALRA